jgi:hypothetical protein
MSENITHVSVFEDAFHLMFASETICDEFKKVGRDHYEFAKLASTGNAGDTFIPGMLRRCRDGWKNRKPEELIEQKLAYVLGWMQHRSSDRQMKPLFRFHEPNRTECATCSIYHDAFLYKRYHQGTEGAAYHPAVFQDKMESLPAAAAFDVPAVRDFFRHLFRQRALYGMQYLAPAEDNLETFYKRMMRWHSSVVRITRYEEAIFNTDPEKYETYIVGDNFYDADEPLLRVVGSLRAGKDISAGELENALMSDGESQYAQAVKQGYRYLQGASDFFEYKITFEEMKDRIDIGKPGRDGIAV